MGRRELFRSGMRIGRDHIASTIYTIVFAYAGAALPVLLLLFLYERPVLEMLQTESMSEEIVRTLASAIGLVLAVPVTTAIAALTVGAARTPAPRWTAADTAPGGTARPVRRRGGAAGPDRGGPGPRRERAAGPVDAGRGALADVLLLSRDGASRASVASTRSPAGHVSCELVRRSTSSQEPLGSPP